MAEEDDIHLQPGDKVDGRWQVVRTLGEGAFGAVYEAIDSKGELEGSMALKLEKTSAKVQLLKIEVSVCSALQGTPHVTHLFACGRNNKYNFMLMSLLGPSLATLRRKSEKQRFSFSTTTKVAYNCIKGLKSMHEAGWLHRDVKPANFAIGATPETAGAVYILDFGLARKFQTGVTGVRPARAAVGFRGTMRYCSMNAHRRIELGRQDDLIGVSYMMVEMAKGELPWRSLQDGEEIYKSKMEHDKTLYDALPKNLYAVHTYLNTLRYEDKPNYNMCEETLMEIIYTMSYHLEPLDWEKKKTPAPSKATTITPSASTKEKTPNAPGASAKEKTPAAPAAAKPKEKGANQATTQKDTSSKPATTQKTKAANPKADPNVDKETNVADLPNTKYLES